MQQREIKFIQHAGLPTQSQLDRHSHWVVLCAQPDALLQLPSGKRLHSRLLALRSGTNKTVTSRPVAVNITNKTLVSLACVAAGVAMFELLTLARKLVAYHREYNPDRLALAVVSYDEETAERIIEAAIMAILAGFTQLPNFKKSASVPCFNTLELYGWQYSHRFRRVFCEAEGNMLARYLSMLPSNMLTPKSYLGEVKKLAKQQGWSCQFYNIASLKRQKAGAFLAVAAGSEQQDAGIVRLRYQPKVRVQKKSALKNPIILVGKGICYDTGGVNLKPSKAMFGMHEDMQGSAVALGSFLALSQLNYENPMECWLALATNHIGPRAYKPNDVITAVDSTTIEVVDTDAEGRMVLADTLALASKQKPALLVDYATLTGACIYALGDAYSGVFTNRSHWIGDLITTGKECGERVWPFPLDVDYDEALSSRIADIKQCSLKAGPDHIHAARFLQRFVKKGVAWLHFDLAASHHAGGLAHIPTATTGFGVRYTLAWLFGRKWESTLK